MDLTETIDNREYFKYPLEFSTIQKRQDDDKQNAPELGEHNIDIVRNTLKYSEQRIEELK